MSIHEMESKIRELRQLQQLIDEATAEAETIKDAIKATMTAQGADELMAGDFRVTWKAVTSSRLDSKALKAAMPDVYGQFCKASTARRFCVGVA